MMFILGEINVEFDAIIDKELIIKVKYLIKNLISLY